MSKTTAQPQKAGPAKRATTLRLDAELYVAAQHWAIDHHTTIQEMVEEGLRRVMQQKRNWQFLKQYDKEHVSDADDQDMT